MDLERVIQLDPTVTTAYLNFGLVVMQQLKNYHRCLISCCAVLINGLLCAEISDCILTFLHSCMHISFPSIQLHVCVHLSCFLFSFFMLCSTTKFIVKALKKLEEYCSLTRCRSALNPNVMTV